MALAFSSYNVGSHSDISTTCLGECTASNAQISNLTWKYFTSINENSDDGDSGDMGEYIITEEASETISQCDGQIGPNGE